MCDVSYSSKVPKKIFQKKYKNKEDIKKLKLLHKKITRAAIFNYKGTRSLLEALYLESIKSNRLKEFEQAILKYRTSIKKNEIKKYFSYFKKILPVYEKLIWNKEYKKLVYKKEKIIKLMKKYDFDNMIQKIAIFYGVSIKNIGIIDVAFYPISYGNNINAYRIKNLETIGVLVNKKQNLKWLMSATILHEISHTIYFKSDIVKENLYIKNKKKNILLVEGFATSIGAGWGYSKFNKKAVKKISWYNNKKYDRFAKKIYPNIKTYLDNNKQLDKKFIRYVKGEL